MRLVNLSLVSVIAVFVFGGIFPAQSANAQQELSAQARDILNTYCAGCHGGAKLEVPGFNVMDHDVLLNKQPASSDNAKARYIIPGQPKESAIWKRMITEDEFIVMPPLSASKRPSAEQLAVIKAWIEAGAKQSSEFRRTAVTEEQILKAIADDLLKLTRDREEAADFRYFSIANLHNDPRISDDDVRLARAGFAKAINHLSRSSVLVSPTPIDPAAVVFRVNLTDLNWDKSVWRKLAAAYPYAITWDANNQRSRSVLGEEIAGRFGKGEFDRFPYMRVDWFVATATQPPFYHEFLDLPDNLAELNKRLGVDPARDFTNNRMMRAGFATSGVSKHNRIVDRHEGGTNAEYYYISSDFGRTTSKGVIFRHPLGPAKQVKDPDFANFAFEEDGGEMIWRLPNGMQGYFITTSDGKRLDKAPVGLVRDLNEFSGSVEIVNGISCIACHKNGIIDYKDTTRQGFVIGTEKVRTKVEKIYAEPAAVAASVEKDRSSYLSRLTAVYKPFLSDEQLEDIRELPEPISMIARRFNSDLDKTDAALELGFAEAKDFNLDRNDDELLSLGLGPLMVGGRIPRPMWESGPPSIYQKAINELDLGRFSQLAEDIKED